MWHPRSCMHVPRQDSSLEAESKSNRKRTAEAVASSSAPTAEPELRMQLPRTTVQTPSLRDIGRVLRSSLGTIKETARGDLYMLQNYEAPSLSASEATNQIGHPVQQQVLAIYLLHFLSRIGSWPVGRLIVLQHVEVAWLLKEEAPHESKRKQSLDKGVLSGVGQRLPQICEDVLEECPCRQPRRASM